MGLLVWVLPALFLACLRSGACIVQLGAPTLHPEVRRRSAESGGTHSKKTWVEHGQPQYRVSSSIKACLWYVVGVDLVGLSYHRVRRLGGPFRHRERCCDWSPVGISLAKLVAPRSADDIAGADSVLKQTEFRRVRSEERGESRESSAQLHAHSE